MCWVSKKEQNIKIADKDIKSFKICRRIDGCAARSEYLKKKYTLGVPYFITNSDISELEETIPKNTEINYGFHSYSSKCYIYGDYSHFAVFCNGKWLDNFTLRKTEKYKLARYSCIIPKGATYVENEVGEIVSDTIIVKKCTKIYN